MPIPIPTTTITAQFQEFGHGTIAATGYLFVSNGPVDILLRYGSSTGQEKEILNPNIGTGQYIFSGTTKYGITSIAIRAAGGIVTSPAQKVQGQFTEPSIPSLVPVAGAVSVFSSALVTGVITPWATGTAPNGAVFCDGAFYDSVADTTFAPLFALIGIGIGGTGPSHFQVPDIRARGIWGAGYSSSPLALYQADGVALANRSPAHNHTIVDPTHVHGITDPTHTHSEANGLQGIGGGGSTDVSFSGGVSHIGITLTNNPTGISINGAATGISVGPGGALPLNEPAWFGLPWIIWK